MITQWMKAPLKRSDEIIMYIEELGMVSAEHLSILLGIKKGSVITEINRINKQKEGSINSHRPIRSTRARLLKKPMAPHMYSLGIAGKKRAEVISGKPVNSRQLNGSHEHYDGVNDIMIQILLKLGHREFIERVEWYNSREATKFLVDFWRYSDLPDEQKETAIRNMIKPDARLILDGEGYFIEFDNDTEIEMDIKVKFRKYIGTLVPIKNTDSIIWVTPREKRRGKLKKWWEEVRMEYESYSSNQEFFFPEMFFLVQEEVSNLVDQLIKKTG